MIDQAVQQNQGRAFAVGANDEIRGLYGIAKWLLVLNLFDGVLTLIWIEHFGAQELNFMMSDLAHGSPLLFMLAKLTLVGLGTLFLWRNRSSPLAVIRVVVAFFSYYLVFLFHLQYSSRVFFRDFQLQDLPGSRSDAPPPNPGATVAPPPATKTSFPSPGKHSFKF